MQKHQKSSKVKAVLWEEKFAIMGDFKRIF